MAALSTDDRKRIWRGLMRKWSADRTTIGAVNKTELQAAVDAIDDWIDQNAAAVNAAIPLPARSQLTNAQKSLLFCSTATMRFGDVGLLKCLLGEVE